LVAVEGFFATLTKRRLRRGSFLGIVDLQAAINRYLAEHNADPKPFRWKADPDTIIAAAARGHQTWTPTNWVPSGYITEHSSRIRKWRDCWLEN
jgi:hypothetical protein